MNEDKHSPYFSVRTRIADILSPKDLVGLKEFTCEVTIGNQDAIIIRDKEDVARIIHEKKIFDIVEEVFQQRDKWAKQRGFTFADQRREKNEA